jgi:hypothetical protein
MPEFEHQDLKPWKTLAVHFASEEDMLAFSRLVGQTITPKTKSIWYPRAEIGHYANKRFAVPKEGEE